jgi:hypothetical protein
MARRTGETTIEPLQSTADELARCTVTGARRIKWSVALEYVPALTPRMIDELCSSLRGTLERAMREYV